MNDTKKTDAYNCTYCQFISHNKTDYTRHILTAKHKNNKKNAKGYKKTDFLSFECMCGKKYKHHSGIWRHKKTCDAESYNDEAKEAGQEISEKDLIMLLLKENKEFKNLIIEQSSKMLELAAKPSTINNTNTCMNQQFNLNVFLNEKCKNAMNMSDFINSIKIMDDDFEDIGKLGYVQGISNIFVKGLKDLDETTRPLHCSDRKRETIYIKENDTWNKDENKQNIIKAIQDVSHKNVKYIPIWRETHPEYLDGTTKTNTQYMKIVNQVMTSIIPDDPNAINKIIKNLANNVCIDKTV